MANARCTTVAYLRTGLISLSPHYHLIFKFHSQTARPRFELELDSTVMMREMEG
jgi:hypothetical protein